MANNFYDCVKGGGKVVNKRTDDGQKLTFCYDKEGKSHQKKNKFKNQMEKSSKPSAPTEESLQQLIIHFNQTNKIN